MSAVPQHRTALDTIVDKAGDVSVLPQVVYKVIELTGKPSVAAIDVERVVSVDPGFSTRVLQLVNSAYYCLPKQVSSIKDAVMFIGFNHIRQLAMTIGAFDLFLGKKDKASMRRRVWWRHSLDTAAAARALAGEYPDANPEEAHAAALLHDLGKSLLDRYAEVPYDEVEALIAKGTSGLEAEKLATGTDHAEAGKAVAQNWRFPSLLVESIGHHHVPGPDMDHPQVCALVAVANAFAHVIEDEDQRDPFDAVPEWASLVLSMDRDTALRLFEASAEAVEQTKSLTGVL
jgi:putative nucleotidyltransferase with HDIG domain